MTFKEFFVMLMLALVLFFFGVAVGINIERAYISAHEYACWDVGESRICYIEP
jgi:hypothetical protein